MKIICTKKEKEFLLDELIDSGLCSYFCDQIYIHCDDECRKNIERNIDWEITDESI